MPLGLVMKSLWAHPVRTLLTFASLVVAVFLICVLRTIVTSLDVGVQAASSKRLVVQSAVSLFVDLPLSYQPKIAAVDGVDRIAKWQWFGGTYQEPGNFFAQFAVDADTLLPMYPEMRVIDGSAEDFLRERGTCVIGKGLAERFGFRVGDTIPLIGTIFGRTDGSAWEFRVAGIYDSDSASVDVNTMFFHFDYLRESLETGAARGPRGVGVYVITLAPGARAETVMRRVDELFEEGPQRVQTTTEAEFSRQFVTMLGNVPGFLASIGGGVLFAILFAALNTMLMAGRERTVEIGIMKAMGFGDRSVFAMLLLESLLLCGLGGVVGVGLALLTAPGFAAFFSTLLPGYAITPETIAIGLAASLVVGLVAGVLPAWRASRLRAVEALRTVV